jgi:hypothetical protein
VYGNAAPIGSIRPFGWRAEIENQIGGDYWKYSMPVNQHGDFWISSLYRRYSWRQHPGDTWGETETGTLTSPSCKVHANYLIFRMSGGRSTSQRIELLVNKGSRRGYFGILFPGSLGDPSKGMGHATQVVTVPSEPQSFPPKASGSWITMRSVTSEDSSESDWMQTYVFDVRALRDHYVRIRIVDDHRTECAEDLDGTCLIFHPEHINADYFLFTDKPPDGTRWLPFDGSSCGTSSAASEQCSPIGVAGSPMPLWGVTDVHSHPMANIAFGGHVVWGDVTDKLEDVYSCWGSLPEIPGPGGRSVIPKAIHQHACYLALDADLLIMAPFQTGCTALESIPFVGFGLASVCHAAITSAEAALAASPLIRGLQLHGAGRFSSGAVRVQSALYTAIQAVEKLVYPSTKIKGPDFQFVPALMPQYDSWPNALPTIDWYKDDTSDTPEKQNWHSLDGLGKSHNAYQADMIRRAFQGGMRLGVWDVVNSRVISLIADGVQTSDWEALKDGTDAAKRIVGSIADIAVIAHSPEEAIQVIQSGKMAVILGTEVDELGRPRANGYEWPRSPHTPGDSMQKQVDDLWELGIRKITPVHAINNPIGGAALFTDQYYALNHFANTTPMEGEPGFLDLPVVPFELKSIPLFPFDIILGDFVFLRQVNDGGLPPGIGDIAAVFSPSWSPLGWINFDLDPPSSLFGFLNEDAKITFRIGKDSSKGRLSEPPPAPQDPLVNHGPWLSPSDAFKDGILVERVLADLSLWIYPTGGCDLTNTSYPGHTTDFGATVNDQFVHADGHRNATGLLSDGEAFLRAAMKKGMIVDVDHMSQKMRIDAYRLAAKYGSEANSASGWEASKFQTSAPLPHCADPENNCNDYPFMGVHTTVRGLEKEGSNLPEYELSWGATDESTRTEEELEHVSQNGGAVGVFPRGSAFIPPNTGSQTPNSASSGGRCKKDSDCGGWLGPASSGACNVTLGKCFPDAMSKKYALKLPVFRDYDLPAEVQNDCDLSSKTFAVKYLSLLRTMHGRGLTLSTDINGFIGMPDPRYGGQVSVDGWPNGGTPGKDVCGGAKRDDLLNSEDRTFTWNSIEVQAQKVEHSGVWYDDYDATATDSAVALNAGWSDGSKYRWKQVLARKKDDLREDGAPRYPVDEYVYFNDHGKEIPIKHWYDQDGNRVGEQLWPMKRWKRGHSGWDFNLDSFQHIGLLPDLIQDMRNVGVQWEQLGPMFRGAQDFIDLWRRSVAIGSAHP